MIWSVRAFSPRLIQLHSLLHQHHRLCVRTFPIDPLGAKGLVVGSAFIDSDGLLQVEFALWDVVSQRRITEGVDQLNRLVLDGLRTRLQTLFMKNSQVTLPTLIPRLCMFLSQGQRRAGSSDWP